ncbi:hypothetical protein [Paenibacillus sp. GCM10027626]|uniref:hypothetical protein n=1 Tax=Paenibacillus sp. GCM10027626 TaxID=3273411 RepID=UPI0036384BFB
MNTWVLTAYLMLIGGPILLLASIVIEQPYFSISYSTALPLALVLVWQVLFGSIGNFAGLFYLLKHADREK